MLTYSPDTGRKLNVHKMFETRRGHLSERLMYVNKYGRLVISFSTKMKAETHTILQ